MQESKSAIEILTLEKLRARVTGQSYCRKKFCGLSYGILYSICEASAPGSDFSM